MRKILVWVLLIFGVCAGCMFAQNTNAQQSQDTQQLQQEATQLEQFTLGLDQSQSGSPQVVSANTATPAETTNAPPPTAADSTSSSTREAGINVSTSPSPDKDAPAPSAKASTAPADAPADDDKEKMRLDIYGFAQLDMGYDLDQNDPNWFDVMRPTKLPASPDEFGHDGNFYAGVRQTRFGVKGYFQTPLGELKTIFEFELFGVGVDAGQTTFRLRHAWGELGEFGAGQTWSPYMDPDVFPNSLEYWGPNGMVFFRNIQARWMPINKGNHQLWFALERPGASGDLGVVSSRIELQNIQGRFPAPDVSMRLRYGGKTAYFQFSAIGRYIAWDDLHPVAPFNFSGHTMGWGINASGNLPVGPRNLLKLAVVYGHGNENYMNDAPLDIAPIATPSNATRPIDGKAIPMISMVAFDDIKWSEKWSSSIGYSMLKMDNTALELASDFHRGEYALANLLYYPAKNVMVGGEFQWGHRENFADGFDVSDHRIQFGFRYNFDFKLGGGK